jgi:hypothetical protein
MRHWSTVFVVLVGAACLMSGCSQTTSPTGPTSVPPVGASLTSSALTASPLAVSAAAPHQAPFKGTFEGSDNVTPPVTIATTATGTGTHLGRFSLTDVLTLNSPSGGTGAGHWVAANGDRIETTFVATAVPGAVVFAITEDHIITGGTGRFSGAEGSFTVSRTHNVAPGDDGTHVTSGSFEGTITLPGSTN